VQRRGAKDLGVDAAEVAQAAAAGAVRVATDISVASAHEVRCAVTGTIGGVLVRPRLPWP
jgi:hypothetical protein